MGGDVPARRGAVMNRRWTADMLERTIATYVQTFVGLLIARPTFDVDWSTLKCLAVASLPAALAVVKAALVARVPAISPASVAPDPARGSSC